VSSAPDPSPALPTATHCDADAQETPYNERPDVPAGTGASAAVQLEPAGADDDGGGEDGEDGEDEDGEDGEDEGGVPKPSAASLRATPFAAVVNAVPPL
jgi:hypothetical protein